jgi:hypothetical protein
MQPVESSIETACGRLASPQTWKNVRNFAVHERAAIELRQDINRQAQLAPGRLDQSVLRDGSDQIAAEQHHRAH